MAETITIRMAIDADGTALNALRPQMDRVRDDRYFAQCMGEIAAECRVMFVAETGAGIVGYVMLNRQSRYQPFRSAGIYEIQDLYVLPDHRRGGVGEQLVQACEDQARSEKCDMIGLAVGLHAGFGSAQRLYTRRGYVPDGFGLVYDMDRVSEGAFVCVDDDLNLMMVKDF
ncbi:GNAT family N-acetyltransferase [Micavibrio aeruginosavorus]|uniref:GNAT family N-acetyltransferase n=1 Tax=Micavibrio aeruginosavorus TaxID=349221 RepID=UPI003F4AC80D